MLIGENKKRLLAAERVARTFRSLLIVAPTTQKCNFIAVYLIYQTVLLIDASRVGIDFTLKFFKRRRCLERIF